MNTELCAESIEHTNQPTTSSYNQNEQSVQQVQQPSKQVEYPPDKTLCVYPLPTAITKHEVINYFRRVGTVIRHKFNYNSIIIELDDSKAVDFFLSEPPRLYHGHFELELLNLKRYNNAVLRKHTRKNTAKSQNGPNKPEESEDPISYKNVSCVIEHIETFDEQLEVFLNKIVLSDSERCTNYNIICPHLDEIFKSIFPECRTFGFGSSMAGLGLKECDHDIYMYVGRRGLPPNLRQPNTTTDVLTAWIFKKVRKVMYSTKHIFSNIVAIPKAKTPIIKFQYLPTNVSCDITFKNGLGVYKTDFLRYCVLRDYRVRSLLLLVKYWARHIGISGVGKISNYELATLVIFYLQQDSVGLLPPFISLQMNCHPLVINGWQVNFDENTPLPPVNNNSTIPDLLDGFFFFYSKFSFQKNVLCLLDGRVYPTSIFEMIHNLPDYMYRYKNCVMENSAKKLDTAKPICIQDPIELNQNTAAVTPIHILQLFQNSCDQGHSLCAQASSNNYKELLHILFTSFSKFNIKQKRKKPLVFKTSMLANKFIGVGLSENFKIGDESDSSIDDKINNWHYIVCKLTRDILTMVFKLEVVSKDLEKLNELNHSCKLIYLGKEITFSCKGNKCFWKNRKKTNRALLDVSLSALEKEIIITEKMEQSYEEVNDAPLEFTCTIERIDEEISSEGLRAAEAKIILADLTYNRDIFQHFGSYANSFIQRIIEKTLIHMLQFKRTYNQLSTKLNT